MALRLFTSIVRILIPITKAFTKVKIPDKNVGTPMVYIVDKARNLRGNKEEVNPQKAIPIPSDLE
jgi:hypothetical protein